MCNYFDCYDGSKLFLPLAESIGMPVDLVNFLIAQFTALFLARLFRKVLKFARPWFRHSVCLALGLFMGYFCFGKQAIHMAVLPTICYLLHITLHHSVLGNVILATSIFYLSCLHMHRQIYHTADYSLDITGPLMVITQRVTSLAYSLQDGSVPQRSARAGATIAALPSPLEYYAYTLAFQTVMCGPVVFYPDYIRFIEGARVDEDVKSSADSPEPSPRAAVACKVAGSLTAAALYLSLSKKYPMAVLYELTDPMSEISRSWSAVYLLWYAYLSTLVVRCKYYHAWLLSEAICNNSGMGFNGYDADGRARWDKVSNIDVFAFEFSENFRDAIANWNKNTNAWLRHVAYTRGGPARTARVYALSAVWHGFYPGYYLTFLAGGLFTTAAKKIRSRVRPLFLGAPLHKLCYDVCGFVTTRVAMTYATVPFVLLHLAPSLAFYGKLYYSLHFLAIGAILIPGPSNGERRRPAVDVHLRPATAAVPAAAPVPVPVPAAAVPAPAAAASATGATKSEVPNGVNGNGSIKVKAL